MKLKIAIKLKNNSFMVIFCVLGLSTRVAGSVFVLPSNPNFRNIIAGNFPTKHMLITIARPSAAKYFEGQFWIKNQNIQYILETKIYF